MRWIVAILTCVGLACGLTGCIAFPSDPAPSDPIAIGMRASNLVVVPCASITAAKIYMTVSGPSADDDEITFFEAHGSIKVTAGEEFEMSASAPVIDGVTTRFTPVLTKGSQLYFLFENGSGTKAIANGSFTLTSKGVPQSGWLQWDGAVTKKPCGYHHRY
jgi:hypothetical protein